MGDTRDIIHPLSRIRVLTRCSPGDPPRSCTEVRHPSYLLSSTAASDYVLYNDGAVTALQWKMFRQVPSSPSLMLLDDALTSQRSTVVYSQGEFPLTSNPSIAVSPHCVVDHGGAVEDVQSRLFLVRHGDTQHVDGVHQAIHNTVPDADARKGEAQAKG